MRTLAVWLAAACAIWAESESAEWYYDRAVEAREAGRYAESLELMRRAHALEPAPELLNNVAWLLVQLGEYRQAHETYALVIADPRADAELKRVDAERIAELAPKLQHAWIVVEAAPTNATLLIDGTPWNPERGHEQRLQPGFSVFETHRSGGPLVIIRRISLPAGRRTTIGAQLFERPENDALVRLDDIPPLSRLAVDGYLIRTAPADYRALALDPGAHTFILTPAGGAEVRISATIAAGTSWSLARDPQIAKPTPPPEPAIVDRPSNLPELPSILTGAAALTLAAAGAVLWLAADSDAATVADARRRADGAIENLTLNEARALENTATTKSSVAAGLWITAGAALAGSLVLYAVQD